MIFLNPYLVGSIHVEPVDKEEPCEPLFLTKAVISKSGNSPPAVRPKLRRIKALDLQIDQLLKAQRGLCLV